VTSMLNINVGRNNNGPKVANFLVVSNDLHETWNDSIAVLRTRHGEIFISTKDMLAHWDRTKGQKDPLKLYRERISYILTSMPWVD